MRIRSFIVLASLLALPGLTILAKGVELQNERSVVEECGARSEAAMSECLAKKSQQGKRMLEQAEAQAAARLSMWDEDEKYINRAKENYGLRAKLLDNTATRNVRSLRHSGVALSAMPSKRGD